MSRDTDIICEHNDRFRAGDPAIPGRVVVTQGLLAHLQQNSVAPDDVMQLVRSHAEFSEDTDPHGEHDMGMFELAGQTCYWKIDLFDVEYEFGASNPTDLSETRRVLTIMLTTDY